MFLALDRALVVSGTLGSGKITYSFDSTTRTLSLAGTDTTAAYRTALNQVTYQDTGTDTSTGSHPTRTLPWTASEGSLTSTAADTTATIDRKPPTTADQNSIVIDQTVMGNVPNNNRDLDGDPLTVSAISGSQGAGTVGSVVTGSDGHLTLLANGNVSGGLDGLQVLTARSKITSISLNNSADVSATPSQLTADAGTFGLIQGPFTLNVAASGAPITHTPAANVGGLSGGRLHRATAQRHRPGQSLYNVRPFQLTASDFILT